MKIKSLLLGLLVTCVSKAIAAPDAVIVPNVEVPQGGSVELAIVLNNETANLMGWQCDLGFSNENLKLMLDSKGKPVTSLGSRFDITGHTISSVVKSAGGYRFIATSMDAEAIPDNSGTLFTVTLEADASLEVGATYEGTLSAIEFNTNDITPQRILLEDVNFTVTIGEPADTRILFNEDSDNADVLKAATGVDVRVKRTIKANQWSTICLPFAMTEEQVKTAFGDDVELGDFTGYDTTEEGDDIVGITVNFDSATEIEANHPYIIKVSAPVTEFTVDGVDIAPEEVPCVSFGFTTGKGSKAVYHPIDFNGTYVADFDFFNDAQSQAIFLSENKFYYATENTKFMKAFRAYFDFDDVLSDIESSSARMAMLFDKSITDINKVSKKKSGTSGAVYDLQGRRVNKPVQGIFIKDGKKIVIEN